MSRINCQIKLFDNQLCELYKIHPTTEQKCRTFLIQLGHSFVYFCKIHILSSEEGDPVVLSVKETKELIEILKKCIKD